jgi:hypothetical protein
VTTTACGYKPGAVTTGPTGISGSPKPRSRTGRSILDGEAVILGVDGISDFNALHSRKHDHEVQLYAFDILALMRNRAATGGAGWHHCRAGRARRDRARLFRAACRMSLEGQASRAVLSWWPRPSRRDTTALGISHAKSKTAQAALMHVNQPLKQRGKIITVDAMNETVKVEMTSRRSVLAYLGLVTFSLTAVPIALVSDADWSAEKSGARVARTDVRTVVLDGRSDGRAAWRDHRRSRGYRGRRPKVNVAN